MLHEGRPQITGNIFALIWLSAVMAAMKSRQSVHCLIEFGRAVLELQRWYLCNHFPGQTDACSDVVIKLCYYVLR